MLRNMRRDFLSDWEIATETDRAASFWARIVTVEQKRRNSYEVTVAIHQARYEALAQGLRKRRDIEKAIEDAMYSDASRIEWRERIVDELEGIPVSEDAVFGPLTLIVEWPLEQALSVMFAVESASDERACIELARLGQVRAKSIVVAISLPLSIFDATVAAMGSETPRRPIDACLYEVICERRDSRASEAKGISDSDIPF